MAEPQKLGDFLSHKFPPLPVLVSKGIMHSGSKVILYGRYKTLKSMIAMRLGLALSGDSGEWLGFLTESNKRVLYLQLEIPPPLLQDRLVAMVADEAAQNQEFWLWTEPNLSLDTQEGFNLVDQTCADLEPDLLIIDPIYKIMSGNLLDNHQVKQLIDKVDRLLSNHSPMAAMLVSHTRKGLYEDKSYGGTDDLIGGVFFSAWADSVIRVERNEHSKLTVNFDVIRHAKDEINPRRFDVTENIDFDLIPDL